MIFFLFMVLYLYKVRILYTSMPHVISVSEILLWHGYFNSQNRFLLNYIQFLLCDFFYVWAKYIQGEI